MNCKGECSLFIYPCLSNRLIYAQQYRYLEKNPTAILLKNVVNIVVYIFNGIYFLIVNFSLRIS